MSGTRHFAGLEEFRNACGEELGTSDWLEIDQDRIDAFADATEDRQWIHVDPDRAAQGPFGATIAHGYLTLSLIPLLGRAAFAVDGLQLTINYGLESVRFPQPVVVGSRIRARASLIAIEDVAAGTRAVVRFVIEIEGKGKPACVADSVRLLVA